MRKRFFVSILLVAMLLLSACGGNSSHGNVAETTNQMSQPSQAPQRVAVTGTDFKNALNMVGYLEEDEFYAYSNYDAVIADGIVGLMYSEGGVDDIPGMRQYLLYELSDLIWDGSQASYTWGDSIGYIVFSDEASAISAVDSMKAELEGSITEKTDNHYSRLTAQEGNEATVIARVDNTCIAFAGKIDCPAYQVFDILGY